MSNHVPEHHTIVDDAWGQIVGGMDWLKSVFFGEFADHRPLSAIVADMLVSFIPGVVIVTSARDAVAVILRMAHHSEKREDLTEWVLLTACVIVIALPLAMAAAGLAAAGVGAVVGGIAGTELGAALRAVILMLLKEASTLVELLRFLQKFVHGNIMKFLHEINFVQYEKPVIEALSKISCKLIDIVTSLRRHLESLTYFDKIKATIVQLGEWEKKFYAVQQDALKHIPKALAELDARLAKVLAESAPKEAHTVSAGVQADKTAPTIPAKQRVTDTPGKVLPKVEEHPPLTPGTLKATPAVKPKSSPRGKPKPASKPPPKEKPEPIKPAEGGANTKKQAVGDAAAVADRERITQLSKEGKIAEAREILQPYVNTAKNSTSVVEREAAMNEIIKRLDVTSDREKMFWSGNKELAAKIATEKGRTILEQTPGGRVIDNWDDLAAAFPWDTKKTGPWGFSLWGDVSANYSKGATGTIDVIQDIGKFPGGGPTWKGREFDVIKSERKVTSINIYGMNRAGDILQEMKVDPQGRIAEELFKVGTK